jgi:hypothetical protein
MKLSKPGIALSLAGSLFLMIGIFGKPRALSETWEWIGPILAIGCFIPLITLQLRRRNARLAAGLLATERPTPKRRFWLLLALIAAASLSGPLWLSYTGTTLPTSTFIITSIISSALASLRVFFQLEMLEQEV